MISSYNWTLKIRVLCEDGIISDILCEGLACNGIEKLSDIKGDKEGLPSFLKEQATYLEQFLNVVISCNYHKYTAKDIVNAVPQNMIKYFDLIWQGLNKEARKFLCEYFGSKDNLLLALFTEKEQVFHKFEGLSNNADEYKNKLLGVIVNTLTLYCNCFSDCIFFSRYFNSIVPKLYIQAKADNRKLESCPKELFKNSTLVESFSSLKSILSTRARNVLGCNGISHLEDFLSWARSHPTFDFLDFSYCGKKSAMELDDFRSKVMQIASMEELIPNTNQSTDKPEIKEGAVGYLVKCVEKLCPNATRAWILDNYGSFDKFAMDFVSTPQSLFEKVYNQASPSSSYELCMSLCDLFAKAALSVDDLKTREGIQANLRILVQQINKHRLILLERMLLTDNKKDLLRIEFNKASKKLSTRTKNGLSHIVDGNDSNNIVAFIVKKQDYSSLNNIGRKSTLELSLFQEGLRKYLAQILFSEENVAEYHSILENYPFLAVKDVRFVSTFYSEVGHLPMFFLVEHFFINSKLSKVRMYREYYGIGMDSPKTLDEIAAESNYTRERVRQIVLSTNQWISNEPSLFTVENWKDYPFIFDDIISKESSDFQHIADAEHVDLTFYAFCGIVRLVDNKIIETFSSEEGFKVCIAYSQLIKGFSLAKAIKELKHLSALNKDVDLIIPLYDFFANNETYWSKQQSIDSVHDKDQIDLANKALLILVRELHIGEIDDEGNIVFKANKLNYSDIIYNIIKSNGAPMRLKEIRIEFDRKHPNDPHNTDTTIRSYILKDERIESIGRTSTYKLASWEGFSGSIPELLVRLLSIKGQPVQNTKLAKEALRYRPDSTPRSIISNINQKVNDGTLCMFYPDLVGLANKDYGQEYKIISRTFEESLKAFVDFVQENKRFPYPSSHGYEGILNHWYNKAKTLISLSDSEILTFSEAIKKLEDNHYPHNSKESEFLSICQSYKEFLSATHRLISDEVDMDMFSWFTKSAKKYLDWKDSRRFYFQDLLNYIKSSISDNE